MINHVKRNTWNSCLIHKKEIWKLLWAILQISKKLIYLIFFLSIFLENYNNKKSKFFSYDNCNLIMFWFFNFVVTKHFFRGKCIILLFWKIFLQLCVIFVWWVDYNVTCMTHTYAFFLWHTLLLTLKNLLKD